jgi:hypothetical protein
VRIRSLSDDKRHRIPIDRFHLQFLHSQHLGVLHDKDDENIPRPLDIPSFLFFIATQPRIRKTG